MKWSTFFCLSIIFSPPFLQADIDHAIISVYAVDSQTGEVLRDENSDLSLIPASCMKVVTTAAALQILGEESRFETCLEFDGSIDNETLFGNIYIRGGGDPTLGSERFGESWQKQIATWVEVIQKLGIKKIEGEIVADKGSSTAMACPSWLFEDLGNYYGAGPCPLSFHENMYTIVFKPGEKIGDKTTILRTEPELPLLQIVNEVTTGKENSGDCACIYGSEYSWKPIVRGTIPLGVKEFAIKGAIPDPAFVCTDLLETGLKQKGIEVIHNDTKKDKRVTFYTTLSPKVSEIVQWTNQNSINLYAEHLFKKIGEEEGVVKFLKSIGIDLRGFNMEDGSGLSRKNLITTKQLVAVLLKMQDSPTFLSSLTDRAKTGSMSLVRGKVGYKGDIVYAILINNCLNKQAMADKINEIIKQL